MRTYPKYLKTMPSFFGLMPTDLIALGIGLLISILFSIPSLWTLIISMLLIGSFKLICRYVDVVGLILPSKKTHYIKGELYDSSL